MGIPLKLEGDGEGMLDFTDVRDVVRGIVSAMSLPGGLSRTFNITFGNAQKISRLVDIIQKHIPNVKIEHAPPAPEKPKRGTLEIDRAIEYLGFKPKYPLDKGYDDYVKWYINEWERLK